MKLSVRMDGWMQEQMYVWIYGCMYGWMDGWMDACMVCQTSEYVQYILHSELESWSGYREQTVLSLPSLVNGILPWTFLVTLLPWGKWIGWYSMRLLNLLRWSWYVKWLEWAKYRTCRLNIAGHLQVDLELTQIGSNFCSHWRISAGAACVDRADRSCGCSSPILVGNPQFFRSTNEIWVALSFDKDHCLGSAGSQGSIWCLFHHLTGWTLSWGTLTPETNTEAEGSMLQRLQDTFLEMAVELAWRAIWFLQKLIKLYLNIVLF